MVRKKLLVPPYRSLIDTNHLGMVANRRYTRICSNLKKCRELLYNRDSIDFERGAIQFEAMHEVPLAEAGSAFRYVEWSPGFQFPIVVAHMIHCPDAQCTKKLEAYINAEKRYRLSEDQKNLVPSNMYKRMYKFARFWQNCWGYGEKGDDFFGIDTVSDKNETHWGTKHKNTLTIPSTGLTDTRDTGTIQVCMETRCGSFIECMNLLLDDSMEKILKMDLKSS